MTDRPTIRTHHSVILRSLILAVGSTIAFVLVVPSAGAGGYLKPGGSDSQSNNQPTWAVPAARMPVEGEGQEAMAAELHNAELRVLEAMQNSETAAHQLKRARTRNYPRGEALEALKLQDQEARRERSAAASEFSALVERARRDGMPMGTLSRYMDLDDRLKAGQGS